MTAPDEPVSYPGLLHFRCGHGISVDSEAVGPSVWMVVTDTDRAQQGVTMKQQDAITIAAALTDSALRSLDRPELGRHKLVGGAVEVTLRRALTGLQQGAGPGLDLAIAQLRWLLGESER